MNTPLAITALVLAGTRPGKPDPVAVAGGVSHKALLPIDGVPMVVRVVHALQAVPAITRIVVCLEDPAILAGILPDTVQVVTSRPEGPSASVLDSLAHFGTPLLVTTADNALLQPEWVEELLHTAADKTDIAVGVATQSSIQQSVPQTRRTYIRLTDMVFSGCNLFYFKTAVSARVADLWRSVEKNRKHPLRVAWTLGLGILLRAVTGRLSTQALYARIYTLTGAQAELVPLSDGRAAVDVDKEADILLAQQLAPVLKAQYGH
ncbi:nucleotidyltransferase family protein [Acetobacter sp.]|jgi:GTP:adenosylcobinamide-phosphate guanylyltransferase|uniref:nucleotidyltransferase family protein n=1 Tax=Acetobacter sp. TaxID=440 RepID=UPI0039E7F52C